MHCVVVLVEPFENVRTQGTISIIGVHTGKNASASRLLLVSFLTSLSCVFSMIISASQTLSHRTVVTLPPPKVHSISLTVMRNEYSDVRKLMKPMDLRDDVSSLWDIHPDLNRFINYAHYAGPPCCCSPNADQELLAMQPITRQRETQSDSRTPIYFTYSLIIASPVAHSVNLHLPLVASFQVHLAIHSALRLQLGLDIHHLHYNRLP